MIKDLGSEQAVHGRGVSVLGKVALERLGVKVRTQAMHV
jgi:hypothetical protein